MRKHKHLSMVVRGYTSMALSSHLVPREGPNAVVSFGSSLRSGHLGGFREAPERERNRNETGEPGVYKRPRIYGPYMEGALTGRWVDHPLWYLTRLASSVLI